MTCGYCEKEAVYRCIVCGKMVCAEHVKLGTACLSCAKETKLTFTIDKMTTEEENSRIREFVRRFWGEEEQMAFDRKSVVAELPAYVAKVEGSVVGFVSFAERDDAVIVVAVSVLPQYQNSGVGSGLIRKVENEAKRLRKRRVLVATSNDNLPALAFYQSLGFQVFEVKPNVIAEKHGTVLQGIGGLPVRDELRLQKTFG